MPHNLETVQLANVVIKISYFSYNLVQPLLSESGNAMIKSGLEKFDAPVVIINQVYQGEDWSVVASYISEQDVIGENGEPDLARIGWHPSVTFPNLDDVEFDQVFLTPEAALEFGIDQIISGNLKTTPPAAKVPEDTSYPFGRYERIA